MLKRAWQLCRPFHWYLIGALGFIFANQLASAVSPLILGSVVTAVSTHNAELAIALFATWGIIGTIRPSIGYLRQRYEIKNLDYEMQRHLSRISMKKFFSISLGQHHLGHSMIKRSVMSKGEAAISGVVDVAIYDVIPVLLSIILPIGFLLIRIPLVGVAVALACVGFTIYTIKYNLMFVPKLRVLDTLGNQAAKKQGEMVANVDVICANAQEERARQEIDEENVRQSNSGRPVWLSYAGWSQTGQWFISLAQVACASLCGYLVYQGKITAGDFVAALMWIGSALGVLTNIGHIQRSLAKSLPPLIKYLRFLDYEPDIVSPAKPVPIAPLRGQIEFRKVNFSYRPRTTEDDLDGEGDEEKNEPTEIPALKEVSFVLKEGRRYAFVGKSGAGKSTLVGLMLRAYDPQEGHVLVDGVDIRMLDFRELRRNIGLVPQEVALFDGTVKYNITFGLNGSADKVTEAELEQVAKLSRVSEFSGRLEQGFETIIGERGLKLSGGQRQRIGIARALIKNPRILIFDEATSSLDTENEAKIRESIREASVGKTTIIIAHRLATVRDADEILVFDDGCLVGQGSHAELLATNDFYRRLVQNQVILA